MENYLLAFSFPFVVSLAPGFALFFYVGQDFKDWSLFFIPNFFSHSHLKKQICLRPVITCAWQEQGFLLSSLALRGVLSRATAMWGSAPVASARSQIRNPEVISRGAALEKVCLPMSWLPGSPPVFLSQSPQQLLPWAFFSFPLKHLTLSHAIWNTTIRWVLQSICCIKISLCDPLNKTTPFGSLLWAEWSLPSYAPYGL